MARIFRLRGNLVCANTTGAAKYGKVDTEQILTMGHSCGGLEAMSVAYHNPNVKHIVMFDISVIRGFCCSRSMCLLLGLLVCRRIWGIRILSRIMLAKSWTSCFQS
ncbi:uncharacterized protein LY89DRAFT_210892 [Mollisia scopiformis]|uniref:1-alkyl-2-acetylglycerophosphocholine esterase n=1 Tax=Mollisia scopiformis TaxID=149040 RepID=A0A194WXA3_MOLSC|nr:uncharacterized protein LY89DRAFT_210892 [Mollisia scopiformis]KUJ12611.1 hypothetical protein LY89DRAFT_210892 [Mollisia scopiformis]